MSYETYRLGDFALSSGAVLPSAIIAYKTYGARHLPAIIYPTWFSGLISDNEWLIGEDKALDPRRYFIIVPAMFGNGESSSPTTITAVAQAGDTPRSSSSAAASFPDVSLRDCVTAQHRLVTEHLGVRRARCVLGWSMAAAQTYQWITQFPDFADLAVPFCGSARTSLHNSVFLEGVKAALLAARGATSSGVMVRSQDSSAAAAAAGWDPEERVVALKAMARVYAGWGFSQAFYRQKLYESKLGYADLEDFMQGFWEKWALSKDPANLLVMLQAWQAADCSLQPPYDGDLELAMRSIKAKTLVLPGKTDLYFPPEDSENEVRCMAPGVGACLSFPSVWGHWAGGPGTNPEDVLWLDTRLKAFLLDGTVLS